MRPFTTSYYPPVMFAERISQKIGSQLKEYGVERVLVFYDKGVYDAGIVHPILKVIKEEGIEVLTYDKVIADPPDHVIEDARNAALAGEIDGIVGLGGGSTLDTAKLIATYMEGETPISRYYSDAGYAPAPLPERKVKLILVPTTAGTGSEVTAVSVITDTKFHAKRTIWGGASFMADLAVVDPCLTLGLPPYITAVTGMDALAHSVETMTSKLRSCRSDTLSGKSVEYIWRSLPAAYENGHDIEARSELSVAAWMTLTTDGSRHLGHCIGHAIGARYHIAHGHACALALPAAMRYVSKDTKKEMRLIAENMHLQLKENADAGEQVAEALESMNRRLGLKTLKEMNISLEDFLQILPEVMEDEKYLSKLDTRPDEQAMVRILKDVYNTGE